VVRTLGPSALPVWSGLAYDGVARSVLLAFKNEGRTELGPPLAAALLAAVDAAIAARAGGLRPDLVPMPRTVRSSRDRGYEPVRVVLRRSGLPSVGLLRLVRRGADQTELGRRDRRRNAEGSMRALPAEGRSVLLVDDVVTTGATLLEAARAVREAGGTVLGGVTVASTPERAAHP
jgi:predicted amidophosphoribosyltransferase